MHKICINCGHIDEPKKHIEGHILIEAALLVVFGVISIQTSWIILIIPFGYSIYRQCSKKQVCPRCHSKDILPIDSPNGKRLIAGKELI